MLPTLFRHRGSLYAPHFEDFVERFFNDSPWTPETTKTSWAPRVEVRETEKEIYIDAELPGIDKKDVKVEVRDNTLTLSGEHTQETEVKEGNYYRSERRYGSFERSFNLGDQIDTAKIDAAYKNGLLTLTLPKTEKALPKEIAVEIK